MSPRFDSPPLAGSTGHPHIVDNDASLFEKPRPRPARSSAQAQEIRTRNRRREYLERNPGYFKSTEHELAGTGVLLFPAIYPDRLANTTQIQSYTTLSFGGSKRLLSEKQRARRRGTLAY